MTKGDRPLVSIVTPTLNQGRFIEHTIRSIKKQTYSRFEHIVVDGGSRDNTVEVLRRYESSYPMRWTSEPDRGMYDAINKGMRTAAGEIVAYLNSDDLYFPWTLETVVEAFLRYPNVDFVYGDALAIDERTGIQRMQWAWPFDLDLISRTSFLVQPTVFWRRRALDQLGQFDTGLRFVGDCDYWMRAGGVHRFLRIWEFLAVERNHDTTLRASNSELLDTELRQVRSRYVRLEGTAHRWRAFVQQTRICVLRRAYGLRFRGSSDRAPTDAV